MHGASFIFIITALFVGLLIGVISVGLTLKTVTENTSIKNGAWFHNPLVGSNEATGYLRATVSIIGFLGMSKKESIYFIAREDDNNETLSGSCTYKVEGKFSSKNARWWSITAYDAYTSKLIPNDAYQYSYSGDTVQLHENGSFTLKISPSEQAHNWIPVLPNKPFDLTLRLYNPSEKVRSNPESVSLPTITKEACQ
jgi:hypothetical protein